MLDGETAQRIRGQWAVAREQLAVCVNGTGHVVVDERDALSAQRLTERPGELARQVADLDVGALVERVGEHRDRVAVER